MSERLPIKYAWLTLLVALTTFGLKAVAAWLTNSVGLFSDALESVVNLTTALLLLWLLRIADQPPDEDHPYGHEKAEYFANGVQGTLILLAGVGIVSSALERFLKPVAVSDQGVGLALAFAAGVFNLVFAQVLIRKGRSFGSEGLKGEGEHLMSDVWTTVAVLLGVGLAVYTGKLWLDPLAAIGVSLVVFATGAKLLKSFVSGLMDTSLPESEHAKLS